MRQERERVHSPSNRRTSPWPRLLISGEHFKPMSQNHPYSRLKCKRGTVRQEQDKKRSLARSPLLRTHSLCCPRSISAEARRHKTDFDKGTKNAGAGGGEGSSRNSEFGIRRVCRIAPLACCCHISLTTASLLDEPRVKFISASIFSEFNGNSHSCRFMAWHMEIAAR